MPTVLGDFTPGQEGMVDSEHLQLLFLTQQEWLLLFLLLLLLLRMSCLSGPKRIHTGAEVYVYLRS